MSEPRTLLVIDRATGDTERIPEHDSNWGESIAGAAYSMGISRVEALWRLIQGEELVTVGFVRKFER